jgi:hypothetical protein
VPERVHERDEIANAVVSRPCRFRHIQKVVALKWVSRLASIDSTERWNIVKNVTQRDSYRSGVSSSSETGRDSVVSLIRPARFAAVHNANHLVTVFHHVIIALDRPHASQLFALHPSR